MRKYKIVILGLLTILILYLCGCSIQKDKTDFIDTAQKCVRNDGSLLLQLFDKLNYYDIYSIELYDNDKEEKDTDLLIDFDNSEFLIVINGEEKEASSNEDYFPICKVVKDIVDKYPTVGKIYNFNSFGYMQIYFKEDYFTIDWSIVYYPPDIDPPKVGGEYEYYEEIKDGFYEYYFYQGL